MKIRPPAMAGEASARSPMSFLAMMVGPEVDSTMVSPVSLTKYTFPSAAMGEAENTPGVRSCQMRSPVLASITVSTPTSLAM